MGKERILITVKTYPTISQSYQELVCTAGFREDGSWVRIYPVPFRKLNYSQQYKKYDWIELELVRRTKDFRPESFRPKDQEFEVVGHIDTRNNWEKRKEIVLRNVYEDINSLIRHSKDNKMYTSLAVFKPTKVIDFVWEEDVREWPKNKLQQFKQLNLFEQIKGAFEIVRKLPYKFSYIFNGKDGKDRKLMIEDWEVGVLFWNCLEKYQSEQIACEKVREKFFDDFVRNKDLYFFLGTTLKYHAMRAPNPFVIVGVFYPPWEPQLKLF